jgi:hypothetical protein
LTVHSSFVTLFAPFWCDPTAIFYTILTTAIAALLPPSPPTTMMATTTTIHGQFTFFLLFFCTTSQAYRRLAVGVLQVSEEDLPKEALPTPQTHRTGGGSGGDGGGGGGAVATPFNPYKVCV